MTVLLSVVLKSVTSPGSTTRDVGEVGSGTISGVGKALAKINKELRGSMPTMGFLLSKGSSQYDPPEGLVFCTRPPKKILELAFPRGLDNAWSCKTSLDGMIGPKGKVFYNSNLCSNKGIRTGHFAYLLCKKLHNYCETRIDCP